MNQLLILKKWEEKRDWLDIYEEEILAKACFKNYASIRSTYDDLQNLNLKKEEEMQWKEL